MKESFYDLFYKGEKIATIQSPGAHFSKSFKFPSKKDSCVVTVFFNYVKVNGNKLTIEPSGCEESWVIRYELDEYGYKPIYKSKKLSMKKLEELTKDRDLWK